MYKGWLKKLISILSNGVSILWEFQRVEMRRNLVINERKSLYHSRAFMCEIWLKSNKIRRSKGTNNKFNQF